MKIQLKIMGIFALLMIIIPCAVFFSGNSGQAETTASTANQESVKILFTQSGEVEELSMEEYMIGAVMAQMPADFDKEALKAQAVLAHTYAVRRRLNEEISPDSSLKGADMSDDGEKYNGFYTQEQGRELYGDDYATAYMKISTAVKAVENEILTYENEPITVAFHAISGGQTESAENAWGEEIPYLIPCDSSWDLEISGCEKTVEFSDEEIAQLINGEYPDIDLSGAEGEEIFSVEDRTASGTVKSVRIGESFYITGSNFASLLSLPSASFTAEYQKGMVEITTRGYGHLVGMSQYGANYMANEGAGYKEILAHYFPNTKLQSD